MNQVIIRSDGLDEDTLSELAVNMAMALDATVEVERQIVVSSDSTAVLNSLQMLFKDFVSNGNKIKTKPKTKIKKVRGEPTRGPHVRSIKILGSGVMISRFELNRRLREHEIEPETVLHSPKYGDMTVKDNAGDLFLVNAAGEQL